MGAETKSYVETQISNNIDIQTEINTINETILKQTSNIMSNHMSSIVSETDIKQEFLIKNVDTGGGAFTVSGVSMKADAEMKLAALTDTALKAEMLEQVQSQLSASLQSSLDAQQSASQENTEGEQIASAMAGVAEKLIAGLTFQDSDTTTKTRIENNIRNYVQQNITNRVESAVESNITNETLSEIANSLGVSQDFTVKNITTGGGDFTVAKINLEAVTSAMVDSMAKSGVGTGIISDIAGVSESVVTTAVTASQTASKKDEKKGTFEGIGDMFGAAFSGTGGIVIGLVSSVSVVGAVGMAFFMMQGQKGGGLGLKMPKLDKNTLIIILLALGVLFALNLRERFVKTNDVVLKHGSKYLYPNGDKLCLTSDKQLAGKFKVKVINVDGKPQTVMLSVDNKFLRKVGSKLVLQNYELFDKEMHDFTINKLSEISFELSREEENIIVKDNCLKLSKKSDKKFKIILE